MPTNYPTALDALNNPAAATQENAVGFEHDLQHSDVNDAIEALEAKVGINGSVVATSLDRQMEVHAHTGAADDGGQVSHADLAVLTTGDPHTQYTLLTVFNDHNARHEPGGADPMAVDAAAATGSLRTLGAGALQASAGTHTHTTPGIVVEEEDVVKVSPATTLDFDTAFFDITDEGGGEARITLASQGTLTVKEEGVAVDISVTTLDFDGSDFNLTESPEDEINIALNYGQAAGQPSEGTHGDHVQTFALSGDISPTQLAANTDNWAPTGLATAAVIRASTDASRNLTGLTGGADGRVVMLMNVGAFDLVLVHDATSTAANRFLCPNDLNYTMQKDSSVVLLYDSTSSRWRVASGPSASAFVKAYGGGEELYDAHGAAAVGLTETIAPANGNVHKLILDENLTITLTGPTSGTGCSLTVIFVQDATGTNTVTWPASVKWAGGVAPVITATGNAVSIVTLLTVDGGTTWYGFTAGLNMS